MRPMRGTIPSDTTALATLPAVRAAETTFPPLVDIVVPVHNEERGLDASIERLTLFLREHFPFSWRVTIVDNASTDRTWPRAQALAAVVPGVRALHLDRKGRGLALRRAWSSSDARVVAYMDVDLSTGLDALLPLVAPLVSGHSDVAIGSRLATGAKVARGFRREAISRTYNALLWATFDNGFRDAQCGFKAVRAEIARLVLPHVVDDAWFFDTELLLLAEANGLRIHEVPVDWIDDPDSRVHVTSTAAEDLRGMWRLVRASLRGRTRIELGDQARPALGDDFGRRFVSFATIGTVSTVLSVAVFLALRSGVGALGANALALTATTLGNTWANRRYTLGWRGAHGRLAHYAAGTAVYLAGLGLSSMALLIAAAAGGGLALELAALVVAWAVTAAARFTVLGASRVTGSSPCSRA